MKLLKDILVELKNNFINKKILIIGDLMIDIYFWGEVKRISPEAPVPVVEIEKEIYRFGGAANVAYNVLKLGGIPIPVGVVGDDSNGELFKQLLKDVGIVDSGLLIDQRRPTTAKTRVISQNQHIVRIDQEKKDYVDNSLEKSIINRVKDLINEADAVIFQDYNKGVLSPLVIKETILSAKEKDKITTVDPKFNNFFEYDNVTVFKPNRKETEDAFGIRINSDEDINKAGKRLINTLTPKYVLLTLGENGVALFENGKPERRIPTKARKVADVSGAGDTVISTLTMALCAGAEINEAAYLANYAGGIVCEEVGVVPIELEQLFTAVEKDAEES